MASCTVQVQCTVYSKLIKRVTNECVLTGAFHHLPSHVLCTPGQHDRILFIHFSFDYALFQIALQFPSFFNLTRKKCLCLKRLIEICWKKFQNINLF